MIIPDFKGEIESDVQARAKYSRDASLFEVVPQAVVFPHGAADVKALVRFVNANPHLAMSLTARAAGTDMSGGPLTESVVVDFTRHMDAIHAVGYGTAVADPGVYYRDLEKALTAREFLLPSYTASKDLCAVGGMVANNSGGEKTLSYGKTADYVRSLNVVLSDGNAYVLRPLNSFQLRAKLRQADFEGGLYRDMYALVTQNAALLKAAKPRVSKNSAGYALWDVYDGTTFDLTRLFSGSQGTLGMITEIEFRTVRPKKHSRLLVMFLNDISPLGDVVAAVRAFKPESFESYDDHTLRLGMRYMALRFGLRFIPEAWMILKNGGFPKLVLLAEFTGETEEETLVEAKRAMTGLAHFRVPMRITRSAGDAEKYWAIRRESFNLLRTKIKGRQTAPFVDDVIVPPECLPQFLPELSALFTPYKADMTYTVAGHMGDGNFHIIPLMDLASPRARQIIPVLTDAVYALVLQYGGSITAEHNDGIVRTPYLEQMYGAEVCALFTKTKHIFDPRNIFNPNKKVGGTKEYALAHIRTE
ncbi:MAG: FAD-binding oxidoreductase [bacterium]|nr:FAD-binding oxidoreductase [bacterium]